MTIANSNSTSFYQTENWHSINWQHIQKDVLKTQQKIAQAALSNKWHQVNALQRFLIQSFGARALAVRIVAIEHPLSDMSGSDGQLWSSPKQKWAAIARLKPQRQYQPSALRRVNVFKFKRQERFLAIPTMLDRAMQALHLLALEPVSEATADPNSYGFRKNRSQADAMEQIFTCTARKVSSQWVLKGHVQGYFNAIHQSWLGQYAPMDKAILHKWLRDGVICLGQLTPTEWNTDQAGILAPTLVNISLDGMETGLLKHLDDSFGKTNASKLKVNVIRYANCFVITGSSEDLLVQYVRPWINTFLAQRGLSLSANKTAVLHINSGFDFLWWNFRKYEEKLLIKPSKQNVQAFYYKVKHIATTSLSLDQTVVISRLNPLFKEWANSHQSVVAKKIFSKLDHFMYWRMMRWGKRRHQNKTKAWILNKYWTRQTGRWEFAAASKNKAGTVKLTKLYKLSDTAIVRHKKIRSQYTPFNPDFDKYITNLHKVRMDNDITLSSYIKKLFFSQRGKCALCGIDLGDKRQWRNHFLVPLAQGGTRFLSNQVLLHTVCQQQVKVLGLQLKKPFN
jgi:RNA-directed DNA polymerase